MTVRHLTCGLPQTFKCAARRWAEDAALGVMAALGRLLFIAGKDGFIVGFDGPRWRPSTTWAIAFRLKHNNITAVLPATSKQHRLLCLTPVAARTEFIVCLL